MKLVILALMTPFLLVSCGEVNSQIRSNLASVLTPTPTPSPSPSPSPSPTPSPSPSICPTNYVEVSPLSPYTTETFCISKYEMKIQGDPDGNQAYSAAFVAESRPDGTPWVNVSLVNAEAECRSLGSEYRLVGNDQWQTVARNIELESWNWGGGSVGNALGISRSLGMSAGVAAGPDSGPCLQTGHTCSLSIWDEYRRVHKLSNGEYIWDLGGNVAEWMRDRPLIPLSNSLVSQIAGIIEKLTLGPSGAYAGLSSEPYGGLGEMRAAADNGTTIRSGAWGVGVLSNFNAGIFSASFVKAENNTDVSIGFRCTYNPTLTGAQTIFQNYVLPATGNSADATALELGVKFEAAVAGKISAIRFYRGAGSFNAGGFTVTLWSSGGAVLATASAADANAIGWQEIALSSPISIVAGTTYIASYYTSNGLYPFTSNSFSKPYPSHLDLKVLPPGGLFKVGAGFPTSSFNDANYFVDVKFTPDP